MPVSCIDPLLILQSSLTSRDPLVIQSLPSAPKRASVAIIFRVHPGQDKYPFQAHRFQDLLNASWAQVGSLEVLFIRRAKNPRDRWSGHVAFPGGKADVGESDRDAAERETREEIGLDLSSPDFAFLGRLDDREVRTPTGSKRIMVLCPFVYVLLTPVTPSLCLNTHEVANVHWVPFNLLMNPELQTWKHVTFPIGRHILPATFLTSTARRRQFRAYIEATLEWIAGGYAYGGIILPDSEPGDFPLWGLTMGMVIDLVEIVSSSKSKSGRRGSQEKLNSPSTYLLRQAQPKYTNLDIDLFVTFFTAGNRSLKAYVNGKRGSLGVSTHRAVGLAILASFMGRVWLAYLAIRHAKRAFIWIKSML